MSAISPGHSNQARSFFLISLPRSLSGCIYHAILRATKLAEPEWTTDGEILNVDRFVFLSSREDDFGRKFTLEDTQPGEFHRMTQFLDQIVKNTGYAYKDVVQPFVVSRWLAQHPLATLRIKRPLADIAYSMLARGWHYPGLLFPQEKDKEIALMKGLIQAENALDAVGSVRVDFDDFVYDEEVVRKALKPFYPHLKPRSIRYIDGPFEGLRAKILGLRNTNRYRAIVRKIEEAYRQEEKAVAGADSQSLQSSKLR